MNPVETAVILDRLGVAYRQEIPPEALEVWSTHLAGVDPTVAADACENIIGMEQFFPAVARFQQEVGGVLRQRGIEAQERALRGEGGPRRDCEVCQGQRWTDAAEIVKPHAVTGEIAVRYQTVRPCPFCAQVEHSRWLEWKAESAAVRRHRVGPDDLLEFNPKSVVADLRDILASQEIP